MTAVAEKLDQRLRQWDVQRATEVERLVSDIIAWADADAQDLMRSRQCEQEVLDLIDESEAR
jgi:hypothetical protein